MGSWVSIFYFFFFETWQTARIFIFYGIKDQIFRDKKETGSVLHLTVFGFLAYNSSRVLKSYGIVTFSLKTLLNITGDRPFRYL